MKNQIVIVAIVSLLVGLGIGYVSFGAKMAHKTSSDSMTHGSAMQESMDAMMAGLEGKTGDEFDKAFISEMIMHHEGALEMAKAALKNAKRQEIKDLANAIISAQTKEIGMMQQWWKEWYK